MADGETEKTENEMKTKTSKITKLFIDGNFKFSGYLDSKTPAASAAEMAARELWLLRGQIAGLNRDPKAFIMCTGGGECPEQYRSDWRKGFKAGLDQTRTKAGVKAALVALGFSKFPVALEAIAPASDYIAEEMAFAEYLVADTDFGGAWNDDTQINMHLK